MSLKSDTEETSQELTNHGVIVCKKSSINQVYCYFSEDCCSLQFAAVNAVLRGIG